MDWSKVEEVFEEYSAHILAVPGVVGISTGMSSGVERSQPCIRVNLARHVERGPLRDQKIPWEIDGVLIEVEITGDIIAY